MITSASARPASGESGLVVNAAIRAPAFAAVSADLTTPEVVPDPEATRSRSPELIAGVVVSPAMWTFRPRCISLMAAIRRTSPLRPAPATNTRPGWLRWRPRSATCCSSILAAVSAISSLTSDRLRTMSSVVLYPVSTAFAVGFTIFLPFDSVIGL